MDSTQQWTDQGSVPPVLSLGASPAGELADAARRLGVVRDFDAVLQITRELFPGEVAPCVSYDPEDGSFCILLRVVGKGSIPELVDRECEWCRRLIQFDAPVRLAFCLSIIPE